MLIGSQREIRRREAGHNGEHSFGRAGDTAQYRSHRAHLRRHRSKTSSHKTAWVRHLGQGVKRCGLDYWYLVDISVYENIDEYFAKNGDSRLYLATTKAPRAYSEADLSGDVTLMFGKETAGLPEWLREKYRDSCIRIPMISEARSLNLSNSVAILTYEALRQQGFPGLLGVGSMGQD